jgi:hypothetical protein
MIDVSVAVLAPARARRECPSRKITALLSRACMTKRSFCVAKDDAEVGQASADIAIEANTSSTILLPF